MKTLTDSRMWRRALGRVCGVLLVIIGLGIALVAAQAICEQWMGEQRVTALRIAGVTLVGWHISAFYGVVALFAICAAGLGLSFIFRRSHDA